MTSQVIFVKFGALQCTKKDCNSFVSPDSLVIKGWILKPMKVFIESHRLKIQMLLLECPPYMDSCKRIEAVY